jgi:hypothetical protein
MIIFQKISNRPTSPLARLNRSAAAHIARRGQGFAPWRTVRIETGSAWTSTCVGRYPGWQVRPVPPSHAQIVVTVVVRNSSSHQATLAYRCGGSTRWPLTRLCVSRLTAHVDTCAGTNTAPLYGFKRGIDQSLPDKNTIVRPQRAENAYLELEWRCLVFVQRSSTSMPP